MNRICVLGLGYIGLPTAALAASSGLKVIGVDIDPEVVRSLGNGRAHIAEPDLDVLLDRVLKNESLIVQTTPCQADIFLVAVPTPITEEKTADLSYVESAIRSVVPVVQKGNLVIVESTIPPGTTEGVVSKILTESGLVIGEDLYVAHCPERVLPGRILEELVNNDRVIGGINRESALAARQFYEEFVRGALFLTNARTAEMVKLVENAYRDVNIAFANELSLMCSHLGVNVWDVIDFANRHPRVNILRPGPGVGGHCIAVDPWFLVEKAPQSTSLIATARSINDLMPEHVVAKVASAVPPGARVACLGASYKADVGDTRESPAIQVIEDLIAKGYVVNVVDPYVSKMNGKSLPLTTLDEALDTAECVVLLVDHSEFKLLDAAKLKEKFANGKLIDTRGIWTRTDGACPFQGIAPKPAKRGLVGVRCSNTQIVDPQVMQNIFGPTDTYLLSTCLESTTR
ncbi:MAG TPA: UDP-N-acetyl-D-mannosamine dehydrogenase [Armatimonadota bacterium]|nr:UDP-N-acetyl-D-mannosamine dehydrogenase [Armatimonadota bacterium]